VIGSKCAEARQIGARFDKQRVSDSLVAENVVRFSSPPRGRILNFAGAEMAAARLFEIEPEKSAATIKVNPGSPQRPLRAEALRRGIMVSHRHPVARGFKKGVIGCS